MIRLFMAFAVSFGVVTLYYFLHAGVSVLAQKTFHYDKPQGTLYKIIGFPVAPPNAIFDLIVPQAIKLTYFNFKKGYLRKEALCFVLNVILYAIPIYMLIVGD